MEKGPEAVHNFRELANSLSLQHRGNTDHSQYMKPSCERIPFHEKFEDPIDQSNAEFDKISHYDKTREDVAVRPHQVGHEKPVVRGDTTDGRINGASLSPTPGKKSVSEPQNNDREELLGPKTPKQRSPKGPTPKRKGQRPNIPPTISTDRTIMNPRRESKGSTHESSQVQQKNTEPAGFGYIAVFVCFGAISSELLVTDISLRCPIFILKPTIVERR